MHGTVVALSVVSYQVLGHNLLGLNGFDLY